ncbi:MAG TPA: hypothetical protein VEB66_13550 [Opitutaceae bacterium]|nr:hypothetical protein [Opitutaceae bacterium]
MSRFLRIQFGLDREDLTGFYTAEEIVSLVESHLAQAGDAHSILFKIAADAAEEDYLAVVVTRSGKLSLERRLAGRDTWSSTGLVPVRQPAEPVDRIRAFLADDDSWRFGLEFFDRGPNPMTPALKKELARRVEEARADGQRRSERRWIAAVLTVLAIAAVAVLAALL